MKNRFLIGALIVAGSFVAMSTGCATLPPGTTNERGALMTNVIGNPEKVLAAAKKTFEEMGMTEVWMMSTKTNGKITGKSAEGDNVKIYFEITGENVTMIIVRVGLFGDDEKSLQIIAKLKKNLAS